MADLNFCELVATAFKLPYIEGAQIVSCPDSICAITGGVIEHGYRLADVVSKTESNPDRFYSSDFVSVDAARLYQNGSRKRGVYGSYPEPRPLNLGMRGFAVFGGQPYEPLASRESALERGRPCWSDLVRDVWEIANGKPCAIVVSTDGKARVWNQPHVRAGVLGGATPVVIYDPPHINTLVVVDWTMFLRDLEFVEQLLTLGFWMSAITDGLFIQRRDIENISDSQRWRWETVLSGTVRWATHWPLVKIIARKKSEQEEIKCQFSQKQIAHSASWSRLPNKQLGLF